MRRLSSIDLKNNQNIAGLITQLKYREKVLNKIKKKILDSESIPMFKRESNVIETLKPLLKKEIFPKIYLNSSPKVSFERAL